MHRRAEMTEQNFESACRELQTRVDMASIILLTTHMSPDGDALGSELALYRYLRGLGKQAHILNISDTPDVYRFMDPDSSIQRWTPETHSFLIQSADLLICLDIGDIKRSGDIADQVSRRSLATINIDHHPDNSDFPFIQSIVDTGACSTGAILYRFMKTVAPAALTRDIAEALYIAIMTDTGNFRYTNTSPETHRIAAELLAFGIDPADMYQLVYEQYSLPRMKLLGRVLQSLNFVSGGKLVWFGISQSMMAASGADQEDTDGFSDMMRSLKGVEVAMMLKERDDGSTRVNFRSKGKIEMQSLARKLGGGGHPFACGATLDLSYDDALGKIPDMACQHVEKFQEKRD